MSMNQKGKRKCGCLNHDIFTENETIDYSFRRRPSFFDRGEYKELLERNLIEKRVTFLCTVCLDYGKRKMLKKKIANDGRHNDTVMDVEVVGNDYAVEPLPPDNVDDADNETPDNIDDTVDDAPDNIDDAVEIRDVPVEMTDNLEHDIKNLAVRIKSLEWRRIPQNIKEALCHLTETVGKLISTDVDNERFNMADDCSSLEKLVAIDPREWYEKRNVVLKSFIRGCTGVDPKKSGTKKFNASVHAMEQLIYAKNINIVTPFAFQRSILTYVISKSKTACSIAGGWEGSGSYTKINALLNSPSEPLTIQDISDIVVAFDNEQKVGRHSGRIRHMCYTVTCVQKSHNLQTPAFEC